MKSEQYNKKLKNLLLEIVSSDDDIQMLEFCRKIAALRPHFIGSPLEEEFIVFIGIDSETDHVPLGSAEEYCEKSYLESIQREAKTYMASIREEVIAQAHSMLRQM
jgi:hypothetical protein